jgi:hypothetical protein
LPGSSQNVAVLITVAGVPAHPLLVHAVVVLIPLAALGALALVVRPAWSRPYGPLIGALALGGAVAATLAWIAGNQLATALDVTPAFAPVIAEHGTYGMNAMIASWPFAVLTVAAAVLARRASVSAPAPTPALAGMGHPVPAQVSTERPAAQAPGLVTAARLVGVLAAAAGIVAIVLTVLAGHTGASAVWGHVTQ